MRSQAIRITVLGATALAAALAAVSAPPAFGAKFGEWPKMIDLPSGPHALGDQAAGPEDANAPAQPAQTKVYVPYRDLPSLIDPSDRAVLMDRRAFAKLLAAAEANKRADETLEAAHVSAATYTASVAGQRVSVRGDLMVVSMSDLPVSVPLGFGQIGLTEVSLDSKDAPLGYDSAGRLVLVVTGRGLHKLTVAGSTALTELRGGGMQFGLSVPTATAGEMALTAGGDLEVHSVSPVTEVKYDKAADKTAARLTIGGQSAITVVLLGNGRQEDQRAIILGNSATTVQLTASSAALNCLYTAEVLRRGVRELTLLVPSAYTITDVNCPSLVKWEVAPAAAGSADQKLIVRLRAASRGAKAMNIQATAVRGGAAWASPSIRLVGADFEQGHLLVDTGGQLLVRGESVHNALRRDLAGANVIAGLLSATQGRLYYHWSDGWQVKLDLAPVELHTSCDARHQLVVAPEELLLSSQLDITAIGRELFEAAFDLPDEAGQWHLQSVTVNASDKGFEYRVDAEGKARTLKIFLASPVQPEGVARVAVVMRKVPAGWSWQADSPPREVTLPIVHARTESVSGQVGVAAAGDLDVADISAPDGLKSVTVGRMAALGLPPEAQLAWTYDKDFSGELRVRASRQVERISAESIGLVTAQPTKLFGAWRLTYTISRARARTLYLLADKSLGRNLTILAPGRVLAGKDIVEPGAKTVELSPAVAKAYDLWQLTLDSQTIGAVAVDVQYERPLEGAGAAVPLVRPAGVGQSSEMLAIQASDELAVTVSTTGTTDVDAIDLPPLPAPASRLLRALRLESLTAAQSGAEPGGKAPSAGAGAAAIRLAVTVHDKYEIPSALATEAVLTTYLGPNGSQQTEAVFQVANVGLQFLTVRLPAGASLWSVRVSGQQARPRKSDSGDYLVAVGRSAAPQEVKVVYAWQDAAAAAKTAGAGAKAGRIRLGAAELPGVSVNRLTWNVYPPPGYTVARQYTDMETAYLSRPRLAGQEFIEALKEIGGLMDFTVLHEAKRGGQEIVSGAGELEEKTESFSTRAYNEKLEPIPLQLPKPAFTGTPKNLPTGVRVAPPTGPVEVATTVTRAAPEASRSKAKREVPGSGEGQKFDYVDFPHVGLGVDTSYSRTGRYTLPIDLQPGMSTGPMASFWSLGSGNLEISLGSEASQTALDYIGLAAVVLAGFLMVRRRLSCKAGFIAVVLVASTLTAVWWPLAARVANGAFYGALWLIPIYIGLAILRWPRKLLLLLLGLKRRPAVSAAGAGAAALLAILALTAADARAGGAPGKGDVPLEPVAALPAAPAAPEPIILPYEGDPTKADANADKVLVMYRRYVELWNRAHPAERIGIPAGPVEVAIAGARYAATLDGERMNIVLTARVRTFGKGWATLPMSVGNLAVTAATLDGKPADIQAGPGGMTLTLPGGMAGELKVSAVTTPKVLGPRGGVSIVLPPLPAAVLTLDLPAADLELEAPGAEAAPASEPIAGAKGLRWTVPVGMQRRVALQWSPKVGAGAADRTLSAAAAHDVYALHWAMVGVSRIQYTFSAGEYERFGLLIPAEATLTGLTGANLRDFREVGAKEVDGQAMKVIEVRLHRPASKAYELTAQWVGKLPEMDKPYMLALPRAAEVGRESGTVTLHAAPGMTMKINEVVGARRSQEASAKPAPSGLGPLRGAPRADEDQAQTVARYYWPYRPFSLSLQLSRQLVQPEVRSDQLVRVDRDQVQLLVQASLSTRRGRIFGTSFALPSGYELLSAVGPVVEDHYEQAAPGGRKLHVNFRSGVEATTVALVLVRRGAGLDDLAVPAVTILDAAGAPIEGQTGRLAVQVAASLDAQTIGSENLRPVAPRQLAPWLSGPQVQAVQFAYAYDKPEISLRLKVSPQKTKVRVEVFGGVSVQPTSAWYSYRLRYQVDGTPIDRVRFRLPTRYAPLVAVRSPAMRSVSIAPVGGDPNAALTEWTVSLINELTGTLDVTLNFATPIDSATTELDVPRPSTDAPEGYRAILAVQNASRHELAVKRTDRLEALPQSEQEKLLAEPIRRNLELVYQSFTDDWSAALSIRQAKPAARVSAIVDLLALTTVIDRTGQCRYEVRVSLQNRTHQFLPVRVPAGLKLWSAIVAGEPVKPVTDPNAGAGVVLIPLVKTEPGGLPYDVQLYLAGPAGKRLGLIGEIKPPAITIEGIDVDRATWSLRLPAGYSYMNPGGNLSPVAARVGNPVAFNDTTLRQTERFFKSNVSMESARGKTIAGHNWDVLNDKLSSDISRSRRQVEANRGGLSSGEYAKLQQKIDEQANAQDVLKKAWAAQQQQSAGLDNNNLNSFLNGTTVNPGVIETDRNSALLALPDFVRDAAKEQIKNINEEITNNAGIISAPVKPVVVVTGGKAALADEGGKGKFADRSDKTGTGTLTFDSAGDRLALSEGDEERAAQVAQLLDKLQVEQRQNQEKRQKALQSQLSQLGDNRLERYYNTLSNANTNSGNNTYSGGVIVNGGAVTAQGNNDYAGNITLSGTNAYTGATTINNSTRTLSGAWNLTVSGGNTYAGNTTVSAGTLRTRGGSPEATTYGTDGLDFKPDAAILRGVGTTGRSSESPGVQSGSSGMLGYAIRPVAGDDSARVTMLDTDGDGVPDGGAMRSTGGMAYYEDFNGPGRVRDGGWGGSGGLPGGGAAGGKRPGLAVSHGTFSLSVSLPVHEAAEAGGVQLDFQGPGDKPAVSILAVDERLIDGAHSTAAVLVIALACLLVWKVGRQLFCRMDPAPRLLAAYVLLAAATAGLAAAGGVSILTGLLVFGAVVVPVELLHRLLARRVAVGAR
jgi:autotransporter-associated beta strand protein